MTKGGKVRLWKRNYDDGDSYKEAEMTLESGMVNCDGVTTD